jgi:ABC-type lipoprotein release transport system permease subunit
LRAYDLVELAGRNLREAVLRNSLTTLGIGVGVASLVAMLSLGVGLQRLFNRQLGRSGLFDSVYVTSRQDFRGRSMQSSENLTPPKPLDDAARKNIEGIQDVVEVYPNLSVVGEFRLADGKPEESHFTVVGGLPESARSGESFDEFQGKFFTTAQSPQAIIMADFGRVLLGLPDDPKSFDQKLTSDQANQLLGKEIMFRYAERQSGTTTPSRNTGSAFGNRDGGSNNDSVSKDAGNKSDSPDLGDSSAFNVVRREQKLTIVGIVNSEPNRGMRNGRTSVFLPTEFAESLNMIQPGDLRNVMRAGEGKSYTALIVRVARSKQVVQVEDQIKKLGFNTFSIVDASKGLTRAFIFLDLFLGIFGSLALAVAFLGIVNTLVMAILERRREIGIMKALGASDGDVKRIFFVEAGSMGALGGALGVGLGWLIGRAINVGTNIYLVRQQIKPESFWYVPVWLVVGALTFSIVVSLFAGLYPASRAARLDPVQALRHD